MILDPVRDGNLNRRLIRRRFCRASFALRLSAAPFTPNVELNLATAYCPPGCQLRGPPGVATIRDGQQR